VSKIDPVDVEGGGLPSTNTVPSHATRIASPTVELSRDAVRRPFNDLP